MSQQEIYIKIDQTWFDVSNFNTHPGGKKILKKYHLQDATSIFNEIKGHQDTFTISLLSKFEVIDKEKMEKIEKVKTYSSY